MSGETELTTFCSVMAEKRLNEKIKNIKVKGKTPLPSPQTIRNALIKLEKEGLIYKDGSGRKKIKMHPDLKIQTEGNILLNYKFAYISAA
jgi:DNA-binding PadR family transcriptional regulator